MAEYITELANDIAKCCPDLVENGCGNDNCVACLSFKLIGLGYTKQPNKADVVPKSEVEKLENTYSRAIRKADKQAIVAIQNAKQEIAREIFEEIEKIIIDSSYLPRCCRFIDIDKLAELKKKYTEGKNG